MAGLFLEDILLQWFGYASPRLIHKMPLGPLGHTCDKKMVQQEDLLDPGPGSQSARPHHPIQQKLNGPQEGKCRPTQLATMKIYINILAVCTIVLNKLR